MNSTKSRSRRKARSRIRLYTTFLPNLFDWALTGPPRILTGRLDRAKVWSKARVVKLLLFQIQSWLLVKKSV